MTIGRAQSCDIVVNDSSVSRSHCEIVFESDEDYWPSEEYELRQVARGNTTVVNGVHVDRVKLEHGNLIKVGPRFFVFCRWYPKYKVAC